jgi:hypothetical protein
MSTQQYWGGPQNGVFDTQNTIAQQKCKMDDLQQIVNQISPGSVPIPASSSSSNISLPISSADVTWFDQNNGDTHSVQQALQTTNTRVSSLESGESSSGTEITLPLSATDVNCIDSDNQMIDLQSRLNFLYLQILNAQSNGGSGSSSSGSNIILPLLSNDVSYYSDVNRKSFSLTVFLNSLELKIIDLQNSAPAESGSGLSIEQEEKLAIIGIPHSQNNQLFLDPAYSIAYSQTQEYLDPVLNFTERIRLQQRDQNGPETDKRGVLIYINYDKSIGSLVIKMNTPTIILLNQFQVVFDMLANTISFIKQGSPYDTTDKYSKATLRFGSDSQKVYSSNVDHDGSSLSTIINTLQADVDELKTKLSNLNTEEITHITGTQSYPIINTLKEWLKIMREDNNIYVRSNENIINHALFLNYLDDAVIQCYKKAAGESVGLPVMPPVLDHLV